MQVHDLGLEKFSRENTQVIGDQIGIFVKTDEDVESKHKTYIRMKVEVNIYNPIMVGFWWTKSKEMEQCVSIKYKRLSDFCYGRGKLGHTTQGCRDDVTMREAKPGHPMFGPWMTGTRPKLGRASRIGGGARSSIATPNNENRRSWFDIMNKAKEMERDK